jgi:hypothetical protein
MDLTIHDRGRRLDDCRNNARDRSDVTSLAAMRFSVAIHALGRLPSERARHDQCVYSSPTTEAAPATCVRYFFGR